MTELERMEAYDRNRRKTMEGVNAYHALLTIYVRLLGQTRSDLNQLVVALARPIDAQAAFERTLALALRAHREIRTVQDSL